MDQNKDGIVTLEDDNGQLIDMKVIEMVEYMDSKYVLLQSDDETDELSYVFKFMEDENFDRLETVEDEEEREMIFKLFEEKIEGNGLAN
ncbi:MAG: DUF1292 domain-containing protein [Clostridiales bacterium]|nr:DUF1292 domain-containing protein [Clostridiales bacterium]